MENVEKNLSITKINKESKSYEVKVLTPCNNCYCGKRELLFHGARAADLNNETGW